MKELVSIIIPIFNVERYLARSLNSVLNQTYENIEIFLVNDGSTDGSGKICQDFAKKDARIRVIELEHSGASAARNAALKQAEGKYIQFVDADDSLDWKATETLVAALEISNSDCALCSFSKEIHGQFEADDCLYEREISVKEFAYQLVERPYEFYYGVLWNKLYKREIIENNNLSLPEDVDFGEDFIFNMEYLKHIYTIKLIPQSLYIYNFDNKNSITSREEGCATRIRQREVLYDAYVDCMKTLGIYEGMRRRIDKYIISHCIYEYGRIKYRDHNSKIMIKKEKTLVKKSLKKYQMYTFGTLAKINLASWRINETDKVLKKISSWVM